MKPPDQEQDFISISGILSKNSAESLQRGGVRAVAHPRSEGMLTREGGDLSQEEKLGFSIRLPDGGCSCAAGRARRLSHLALNSVRSCLLVCSDLLVHTTS